MVGDKVSMGDLFNFWSSENNINTFRSYIVKYPLLLNGANTGGTSADIVTGTGGTLHGTYEITPQANWIYVLGTLTRNAVQSGTFGTLQFNQIAINGVPLGTVGNIAFKSLYDDNLTLWGTLAFKYQVNCGTGVIGTFKVDYEVSGWKFRTKLD